MRQIGSAFVLQKEWSGRCLANQQKGSIKVHPIDPLFVANLSFFFPIIYVLIILTLLIALFVIVSPEILLVGKFTSF